MGQPHFMKWIVASLLLFIGCVHANTESILYRVPHDFPLSKSRENVIFEKDTKMTPSISLLGEAMGQTTVNINTTNLQLHNTTYIELTGLQRDDTYQIKVCWSAIHPISIINLQTVIIPRFTEFQQTTSDYARVVVKFLTLSDSYPNEHTMVPIQISLVTTRLGIPVDIYPTLVIIVLLVVGLIITRAPRVLNDVLLKF